MSVFAALVQRQGAAIPCTAMGSYESANWLSGLLCACKGPRGIPFPSHSPSPPSKHNRPAKCPFIYRIRAAAGIGIFAAPARCSGKAPPFHGFHGQLRKRQLAARAAVRLATPFPRHSPSPQHNAANEYLDLIERAENGGHMAYANWTAPSSGQ
jgi:hypothetical protein